MTITMARIVTSDESKSNPLRQSKSIITNHPRNSPTMNRRRLIIESSDDDDDYHNNRLNIGNEIVFRPSKRQRMGGSSPGSRASEISDTATATAITDANTNTNTTPTPTTTQIPSTAETNTDISSPTISYSHNDHPSEVHQRHLHSRRDNNRNHDRSHDNNNHHRHHHHRNHVEDIDSYNHSRSKQATVTNINPLERVSRMQRDLSESIDLTDDPTPEVIDILDDDDGKTTDEQLKENAPKELNERTSLRMATCCVCFDSPEMVALTPCGHLYCSDCVFRALSASARANTTRGECSICRRKVPYNQVKFLELRLPPSLPPIATAT